MLNKVPFFSVKSAFFIKGAKETCVKNATEIKKCFPVGIYAFKVNNRNTRTRFEICSKLTIKTSERRHLVSLLLTLNIFHALF